CSRKKRASQCPQIFARRSFEDKWHRLDQKLLFCCRSIPKIGNEGICALKRSWSKLRMHRARKGNGQLPGRVLEARDKLIERRRPLLICLHSRRQRIEPDPAHE